MKRHARILPVALTVALFGLASPDLRADDTITCESKNNRRQSCRIPSPGYVTLDQQLSRVECRQGRTWDYDRREIWVDDGCRGRFTVHTGSNDGDSHKDSAKVVAGLIVGAAILGALAHNSNKDDKYDDDRYEGPQHSSYVPRWMIGSFEGYNTITGKMVNLDIEDNGRVTARSDGRSVRGWINQGRINLDNEMFNIDQTREGFVTSAVGDRENEVRYRRVR